MFKRLAPGIDIVGLVVRAQRADGPFLATELPWLLGVGAGQHESGLGEVGAIIRASRRLLARLAVVLAGIPGETRVIRGAIEGEGVAEPEGRHAAVLDLVGGRAITVHLVGEIHHGRRVGRGDGGVGRGVLHRGNILSGRIGSLHGSARLGGRGGRIGGAAGRSGKRDEQARRECAQGPQRQGPTWLGGVMHAPLHGQRCRARRPAGNRTPSTWDGSEDMSRSIPSTSH